MSHFTRFTAIFAGGTMFSRVLGLIRDIIIAAYIPALSRDAFIVAFRFPNMLRDMLGEGAANAALVPVFSEAHEKQDEQGFRELIRAVMGAMLLVFGVVTALGLLLIPFLPAALRALQPFTASNLAHIDEIARDVPLMLWTFPYLLFIGLTVFATAPLFVVRHYSTPSWSPALLNVALIATCLLLYDQFLEPAWSLVIGVWLGGIAQLLVMFYQMQKRTGVLLPSPRLRHPGVRRVFWLLGPVIAGQAAGEVNKLVDTFFAYSLGEGVVSALFFANRLIQLPLSIFGVAVSVAILPELSRAAARNEHPLMRSTLVEGLRQTCFLTAPAMFGLIVLAEPLVRVLFQHREFTAEDTEMTATAVVYYGAGLLSFAGVKVLVQGFYALQNTRTPVAIAAFSMILNIVLNFLLIRSLGYRGLALSTTLSYTVNFLLLYLFLTPRYGVLFNPSSLGAIGKILAATLLMAATVYSTAQALLPAAAALPRYLELLIVLGLILLGALVYALAAKLLGVQELNRFMALLKRRTPN